uniref:Uncharacterized protein n=1 Tax=Helianthus annuus TaxID=4232 RepID=A0A251VAL7_HELAN
MCSVLFYFVKPISILTDCTVSKLSTLSRSLGLAKFRGIQLTPLSSSSTYLLRPPYIPSFSSVRVPQFRIYFNHYSIHWFPLWPVLVLFTTNLSLDRLIFI